MSKIPEYGTPDEDSAELTERDFALARRRDGSPVNPEAFARVALAELQGALASVSEGGEKIKKALKHLKAAQAEFEEG